MTTLLSGIAILMIRCVDVRVTEGKCILPQAPMLSLQWHIDIASTTI